MTSFILLLDCFFRDIYWPEADFGKTETNISLHNFGGVLGMSDKCTRINIKFWQNNTTKLRLNTFDLLWKVLGTKSVKNFREIGNQGVMQAKKEVDHPNHGVRYS